MKIRYQAETNMGAHEVRSIMISVPQGRYVISSSTGKVVPRNTSGGTCEGTMFDAVIEPVEEDGQEFALAWLESFELMCVGVDCDVSDPLSEDEPKFDIKRFLVIDDNGKKAIYDCSTPASKREEEAMRKMVYREEFNRVYSKGVEVGAGVEVGMEIWRRTEERMQAWLEQRGQKA